MKHLEVPPPYQYSGRACHCYSCGPSPVPPHSLAGHFPPLSLSFSIYNIGMLPSGSQVRLR